MRQLPPSFKWDGIVCDDMGTEIADFIVYAKSPPTVAFIHAKRPSVRSSVSASSLHVIVSQATKNLNPLRLGGPGIPKGRATLWNRDWKEDQRSVPRIRAGPRTGRATVDALNALLESPKTQRHVAIVIAGGIDRAALLKEIRKAKPRASALQAFALLSSFYSSAVSLGTIPTIICD